MTIWDTLIGRKSSSSTAPATATPAPDRQDSFQPTPFNPQEAQDVSSFLGGSTIPDPSQLHPLAGLNQQTLDYLSLDDSTLSDLPGAQSALPSRGWSDDLCYGTGVTYLSALTIGGAWGLQEGLRRSTGQPPKLRLNSVLNAVTRRGPFLGNSAGVIAMVYNGFNSYIGYVRGKHDSANSIAAGALSGILFKSTRGIRPMMISGGIVATVAGAWAVRINSSSLPESNTDIRFLGNKKGPLLISNPHPGSNFLRRFQPPPITRSTKLDKSQNLFPVLQPLMSLSYVLDLIGVGCMSDGISPLASSHFVHIDGYAQSRGWEAWGRLQLRLNYRRIIRLSQRRK
jgi:import inner membrane translocase subunit TIM23